jgi:hypothetical protein
MAGVYTRYMVPFVFIQFLASPVSTVFFVLDRQGTLVAFQTGMLLTRSSALWFGGMLGGNHLPILLFGTASFILYLVYLGLIFKITGAPFYLPFSILLSFLPKTMIYIIPALFLDFYFSSPIFLYGYSLSALAFFSYRSISNLRT